LRTPPARNRFLLRARQRELPFEDFAGDRRTGADRCTTTYRHRRHELRIRADEHVVFDDGAVLVGAIVIAGDRARADVHVAADAGIADVGQVIRFRAVVNLARLHLDEVADMNIRTEPRAWANA